MDRFAQLYEQFIEIFIKILFFVQCQTVGKIQVNVTAVASVSHSAAGRQQ